MNSQWEIAQGLIAEQQKINDRIVTRDLGNYTYEDQVQRQANIIAHLERINAEEHQRMASAPPMNQQDMDEQLHNKSLLHHAVDAVSWAAAPLGALGAFVAAPMAYDKYKHKWYDPRNWVEQVQVGAEAAAKQLFPEYGEALPSYGTELADKMMPESSDVVKSSVGILIDLATDPLTAFGVTAPTKFIQQGLRAGKMMEAAQVGGAVAKNENVFMASLNALTDMRILDPALIPEKTLKGMRVLADKAYQGDREAAKQLMKELDIEEANKATVKQTAKEMDGIRQSVRNASTLDEAEFLKSAFSSGPSKKEGITLNYENPKIISELMDRNPGLSGKEKIPWTEVEKEARTRSLKNILGSGAVDEADYEVLNKVVRYVDTQLGKIARKMDLGVDEIGDRAKIEPLQQLLIGVMKPYLKASRQAGRVLGMRKKNRFSTPLQGEWEDNLIDEAVSILSNPEKQKATSEFGSDFLNVLRSGGSTEKFLMDQARINMIGNCK